MSVFSFKGSRRQDLLDAALRQLQAKKAEDPVWESQTLLARCLGLERLAVVADRSAEVASEEITKFADWLRRYLADEPLAYLEGKVGFFGHEFQVDSRVLVPRADSECVVEAGLQWMASREPGMLVDVGTGSGCLLLTLLLENPAWRGLGIDYSAEALQVANANRHALGLAERCSLMQGSWLHPVLESKVDFVVSNPPYIVSGEELGPGVKEFEPHLALFAPGNDPMEPYKILLGQASTCLKAEGALLFEVGAGRSAEVRSLANQDGFLHIETRTDLGGVERGVLLGKQAS
ncbi:MAG: peptide chain release factor N(5)-glutamine methyltransferase [Planctomycetota bacterium]|nr:peptide chain release factor N(5)-glutamine methyltransferase [Planctomycetota bacterium]MDA1112935.1 peptide chain release factor N(5)-glutamine methyltransferase [Planctomycetota bacterium]